MLSRQPCNSDSPESEHLAVEECVVHVRFKLHRRGMQMSSVPIQLGLELVLAIIMWHALMTIDCE
jgi:hypothetical protein